MKKRKYTHIKELEPILLQMREDGASRREIAAGYQFVKRLCEAFS